MVGNSSEGCVIGYYITIAAVTALGLAIWIIYGYTLYFSPANECQKSPDQFGWLVIMVILLFFGFFLLVGISIMLCCACCLGAILAGSSSGEGEKRPGALDGFTKKVYNPDDYKFSDTCTIC
jgi:uncharacterized membrane protein